MWQNLFGLVLLGVSGFVPDSLWVKSQQVPLPCPWRDRVWVQGARIAGWHGDTLLLEPFSAESVQVYFLRWTPCPTPPRYSPPRSRSPSREIVPQASASSSSPGEALWFRGFKRLAITGGPGTPTRLQQATQVQLQGRLGRYQVNGVLSDQNLSATGVEELGAVDRVLLTLQGPHLTVRLGDLDLASDPFGPGLVRGRGGTLQGKIRDLQVQVAYTLRRGEPQVVTLTLRDGDPGPYPLDPEGRPFRVLPGSERVYLNGERLQPGPQGDYLLDYQTGTLVFTPGRRIQHTDHLRVEFERLQSLPGRTVSLLSLGTRDSTWQVSFLQDGYLESTLRAYLSPADLALLAALGDTSGEVVLEDGLFVGPGRGEYVREDSVFRYVGPGQGDHQVFFEFVGDGQGDYAYDAILGGYRFVGRHQGAYQPRLRQAIPSRLRLVELQGRPPIPYGHLSLRLAAEDLHRNVLAPTRHQEGAGEIRWQHRWTRLPGTPQITLYGFGATPRFQQPGGRRLPAHLTDRFRLSGTEAGRIRAGGGSLFLTPASGWLLQAEVLDLWLRTGQGRYRRVAGTAPLGSTTLQAFAEDLRRPSAEHRLLVGVLWSLKTWPGTPTIQVSELHEDTAAYREVAFRWTPGTHRLELYRRRAFHGSGLRYWGLVDWPMATPPLHPRLQMFWAGPGHEPVFLAQVDWHGKHFQGHHEWGRGALPNKGLRYVYVGPGNGNYTYDPETGEYHPDPQGAYRRETVNLGTLENARIQRHHLQGQWQTAGQRHHWSVDWQRSRTPQRQHERWWLDYTGTWFPWSWQVQVRSEAPPGFQDQWWITRMERRLLKTWQILLGMDDRHTQGTYLTVQRHQTPWLGLLYRRSSGAQAELRFRYDRVWPAREPGPVVNPRGELRIRSRWTAPGALQIQAHLTVGLGQLWGALPAPVSPVVLNLEPGVYLQYQVQIRRALQGHTTLSLTATGDRRAHQPARHFLSASLNLAF